MVTFRRKKTDAENLLEPRKLGLFAKKGKRSDDDGKKRGLFGIRSGGDRTSQYEAPTPPSSPETPKVSVVTVKNAKTTPDTHASSPEESRAAFQQRSVEHSLSEVSELTSPNVPPAKRPVDPPETFPRFHKNDHQAQIVQESPLLEDASTAPISPTPNYMSKLLGFVDLSCLAPNSGEPENDKELKKVLSFTPEWGVAPSEDGDSTYYGRGSGGGMAWARCARPAVGDASTCQDTLTVNHTMSGTMDESYDLNPNDQMSFASPTDTRESEYGGSPRSPEESRQSMPRRKSQPKSPGREHENFELVLDEREYAYKVPDKRGWMFKSDTSESQEARILGIKKREDVDKSEPKSPKAQPKVSKNQSTPVFAPLGPLPPPPGAPKKKLNLPPVEPVREPIFEADPAREADSQRESFGSSKLPLSTGSATIEKQDPSSQRKSGRAMPKMRFFGRKNKTSDTPPVTKPPKKVLKKVGKPKSHLTTVREEESSTSQESKELKARVPGEDRVLRYQDLVGDELVDEMTREKVDLSDESSSDSEQEQAAEEEEPEPAFITQEIEPAEVDKQWLSRVELLRAKSKEQASTSTTKVEKTVYNQDTRNSPIAKRVAQGIPRVEVARESSKEQDAAKIEMMRAKSREQAANMMTLRTIGSDEAFMEEEKKEEDLPAFRQMNPDIEKIANRPTTVKKSRSWKEKIGFRRNDKKASQSDPGANNDTVAAAANFLAKSFKSSKDPPVSGSENKPQWKATVDPNTGKTYYYHRLTRKTTWSKPPDHELHPVAPKEEQEIKKSVNPPSQSRGGLLSMFSSSKPTSVEKEEDSWFKKEIGDVLAKIVPADMGNVDRLVNMYPGREDELLDELRDIAESQPFDEPLASNNTLEDTSLADKSSKDRARTGASVYSGLSGNTSKFSENTHPIKNTTKGRTPTYLDETIEETESHATSISSKHDENFPIGESKTSGGKLKKVPSNVPVPRRRELMVEEFTNERVKAETFDMKKVSHAGGRRVPRPPQSRHTQRKVQEQARYSPLHHGAGFESDNSTPATDSISALSETDNESLRQEALEHARRRALDEAIAREDWDLAAALSEGMRSLNKQKSKTKPSRQEWTQSELDRFISENDWDAVANYIANVRAKAKASEEVQPPPPRTRIQDINKVVQRPRTYPTRRVPSDSSSSNPQKRFGARSQLQHSELHSVSSWESSASSYESDYTSADSFFSEEDRGRLSSRRKKEFAC